MRTFADLFCGLGGFRLALEAEGLECVFSCEIEKHVAKCYEDNFGDHPVGDIREINAEDVPDCDIICGGFPCQPWSIAKTAGLRGQADSRGDLFEEILRIAKVKKPKALILENVPGILSPRNNLVVQRIHNELVEMEYDVRTMKLNSAYFGIPQARERVYFVALRKDLNLRYFHPEPTYEPVCVRDILMDLSPEDLEKLEIPLESCHLFDDPKPGVGKPYVGDLRLFTAGYMVRRPQGGKTLRDNGALRAGFQVFDDKGVSPTITATEGKVKGGRNLVATQTTKIVSDKGLSPTLTGSPKKQSPRTIQKILSEKHNVRTGQNSRIYSEKGVAPCLDGQSQGGRQKFRLTPYRDNRIYDSKGMFPVLDGRKRNDKINIRDIGQGYEVYDTKGASPSLIGKDHEKFGHVKIVDEEGKGQGYSILEDKGVSSTLCGPGSHRSKGHQNVKTGQIVRRLHIIEYKRLMDFPDGHIVSPGVRGYGQLGNAVIPRMIQLIYRGIREQ